MTRIEALSDAVFGFASMFLFVSFDVPTDFDALMLQLRGLVPSLPAFVLLILVWQYPDRAVRARLMPVVPR